MLQGQIRTLYWVVYMYKIKMWLESIGWSGWEIEVASSDASFRSYYRIRKANKTYILMDSSLMLESLKPFIDMNERLSKNNVHVPSIVVKSTPKGYLILEDFGNRHYLDILNSSNYENLYKKAIDEIVKMQKSDTQALPLYDKQFLLFEMNLMQEWYLEKYLNITLSAKEKKMISTTLEDIVDVVLEQPQNVFVHRDYHSRNIMITPSNNIGIIDFQDARIGAITYDLVSLLKDCYIKWDRKEIEKLALYYKESVGLNVDNETFIKWFDFMGLQRHIKVLGIFSRLHLRDGKDEYLKDIPLTLEYILETGSKYTQTEDFVTFLKCMKKG